MNLPNALTILRMLLVPIFVCLFYADQSIWALIVYLAAGATDLLDGYLARRLNQVTSFGKLCDPLADKLMQCAMLFCLAASGRVSFLILGILIMKELYMMVGALYMLRKGVVVQSNRYGKAATFLMILAIVLVYPWHTVSGLLTAGRVLLLVSLGLSLLSAGIYTLKGIRQIRVLRDARGE